MSAVERPTDGPDSELAAIVDDLDDLHTEACSVAMRSEGSLIAATEELRDDVASIRDRLQAVLARPAAGRDLTDVEDGPTLNSELGVPPRATARIEQARADQAEGYGSTTSVVEGLLRELDRRGGELVRLRAALARSAVARTEGQPDPDPHGRYDVPDAYDHPGWPLVSRIVAIATDTDPTMPDETDGVDNAVTGLLADQSWRDHVAMADVMGLVGDWGTDDVVQAVTDALHEYPRLRARVARTDGQPPADEPDPLAYVEPGDPAGGLGPTEHDDPICSAEHDDGIYTLICTRDPGHPGQHIAAGAYVVEAVWPAAPADDTAAPDGSTP